MEREFDREEAKRYLLAEEEKNKLEGEEARKALLKQTQVVLKAELKGSAVESYLIGSVIQPFRFSSSSDIDIVLKNYEGDRFDIWTKLEKAIGRKVEIIIFETCRFQEFVLKEGLKVT